MNGTGIYEVIAGITLMITGVVLGYDGLWGAMMILLGVLLLLVWLARMGGMF
jgi:Flp pilus assembly protein TadB